MVIIYQRTKESAFWPSGCSIFSHWRSLDGFWDLPHACNYCCMQYKVSSCLCNQDIIRTSCYPCSQGRQEQPKQLRPAPQARSLCLNHSSSAGTWGLHTAAGAAALWGHSACMHTSALWWSRCPPPDSFLKKKWLHIGKMCFSRLALEHHFSVTWHFLQLATKIQAQEYSVCLFHEELGPFWYFAKKKKKHPKMKSSFNTSPAIYTSCTNLNITKSAT